MNKTTFNIVLLCLIIISLFFLIDKHLLSQFLYEEESEQVMESVENKSKREGRYPVDVAYNIRAVKVQDSKNAIMITWDVHPDYKGSFVLARSSSIIDTREKALKSQTIKTALFSDNSVHIDNDLAPGSYFYVILAKDRIASRDVELFADVNYTTYPVVISDEKAPRLNNITRISAKKISSEKVMISWVGLEEKNIIYTVYRSRKRISDEGTLALADKVTSLTDGEFYIDDSIPVTGTYYYAVMTKKIEEMEHQVFIPGETYTTTGVFIYKQYSMVVQNINAVQSGNDVRITWNTVVSDIEYEVDGYALYRSSMPISNYERLDFSKHVDTLDGRSTSYTDRNPGPGKHYYALLVKFKNGVVDTRLQPGYNYTTEPVGQVSETQYYDVKSIDAQPDSKGILVTWKYSGGQDGRFYNIYRTNQPLRRIAEITTSMILGKVDITTGSYGDETPAGDRYYYGLLPINQELLKKFRIMAGVNITMSPVASNTPLEIRPAPGAPQIVKPENHVLSGTIDEILKRTFFKGKYNNAIKELQDLIKTSDNNIEIAKAKLFIGRSHIEKGQFSKALVFLSLADVQQYFPEEAVFWQEYAMTRVK